MSVPVLTPHSAREQRTFRALLDGMARPGSLGRAEPHPRGGRLAAAVTILEAVLDHEVTFAVVPEQADVTETILRLTGSYAVAPEEADYLLCTGDGIAMGLRAAKEGTPEYPDRSATIIALVRNADDLPSLGTPLTLAGPGIDGTHTVRVEGFPQECREQFAERNAELPMGIDLVLLAPDGAFTCLPRSTRLVGEEE